MQCVSVVHRDIHDDAASSSRLFESPTLQPGRKINRMKDPSCQGLADSSLLNQSAQSTVGHGIPEMMIGAQDDVCLLAGFEHLTGIRHGQRQWLFTKHMFSC